MVYNFISKKSNGIWYKKCIKNFENDEIYRNKFFTCMCIITLVTGC